MKKILWPLIVSTALLTWWCWDSWIADPQLKHSYAEKSRYRSRLTKDEKLRLLDEHFKLWYQFKPYELEIEANCTKEHNNFKNWWELSKVKIFVDWDDEESKAIEEIIYENLRMYKASLFRNRLEIHIIPKKEYKDVKKLPWLWVTRKNVGEEFTRIYMIKENYTTTTLHHELAHYFQYQANDNIESVNQVLYDVTDKYLKVMNSWESKDLLFVSDYSLVASFEDSATIHESFVMQWTEFTNKLRASKWMRDKVQSLYWVKLDEKWIMKSDNYSRDWSKKLMSLRDLNNVEYINITWWIQKWSEQAWFTMFPEINYKTLNQMQVIRSKISNCIVQTVLDREIKENWWRFWKRWTKFWKVDKNENEWYEDERML